MADFFWTPPGVSWIMNPVSVRNIFAAFLPPYGAAPADNWDRLWDSITAERLVFWVALLAVFITVAWYVLGKINPKAVQKEHRANEWLAKCREMHDQGGLSDEEFRTIKTTLTTQLQDELNDNGENG
jgi:hypothetical protein